MWRDTVGTLAPLGHTVAPTRRGHLVVVQLMHLQVIPKMEHTSIMVAVAVAVPLVQAMACLTITRLASR